MTGADLLWVALAGGAGAVARFVVDRAVRGRSRSSLPLGTVAVNLSGSFVLGVLSGLVLYHHLPSTVTLVAGTGFCGGYTTFSAASFETLRLVQVTQYRQAASVGLGSLVGAIGAAAIGMALAST